MRENRVLRYLSSDLDSREDGTFSMRFALGEICMAWLGFNVRMSCKREKACRNTDYSARYAGERAKHQLLPCSCRSADTASVGELQVVYFCCPLTVEDTVPSQQEHEECTIALR